MNRVPPSRSRAAILSTNRPRFSAGRPPAAVMGFAENRIDFSVLADLTDQDLKDLGVVLGDSRKMYTVGDRAYQKLA